MGRAAIKLGGTTQSKNFLQVPEKLGKEHNLG